MEEERKQENPQEIVLEYHPEECQGAPELPGSRTERFTPSWDLQEETGHTDAPEDDGELDDELFDSSLPMWRDAVNPREGGGVRWKAPVIAALILILGVGSVILGLSLTWRSVTDMFYGPEPEEPPAGEHYWDSSSDGPAELPLYPFGGDVRLTLNPADASAGALSAGEIYRKVGPSAVAVVGQQKDSLSSSVGTGVIFSQDGYILTNYHVVDGCTACMVLVTDEYGVDQPYDARMVGGDADRDLAVLKIDAQGLPAADFGVSDDLAVGDKVYAIGNPLGLELRGTLTDGIISAMNRDVDVDGVTMTLLQTNAALNSGNSGGPLINQYGQVVGINTIKMMGGEDTVEGLGFAIPSSIAVNWVNQIIETGEIQPEPVLGLMINRIPKVMPDGTLALEIIEVNPGLSGEKAGVLPGDMLISFNGKTIHRTEEVLAIRRELRVGDQIPIRVYRNGEYLDLVMEMMAPLD